MKFDISECNRSYIPFKVAFNCTSSCQKSKLIDRRHNLVFKAIISGPRVKDIELCSTLSVQTKPARGAQVLDVHRNTNKLQMVIKLELDQRMERSRLFDKVRYQKQMSADLHFYAQTLHYRDKLHYAVLPESFHLSREERLVSSGDGLQGNNNDGENSGLVQLNQVSDFEKSNSVNGINAGQCLSVNVEIPRDFYGILSHQKAEIEIGIVRSEMEKLAQNRIQDLMKRAIEKKHTAETEKMRMRNLVVFKNDQITALSLENNQLKSTVAGLYNYIGQFQQMQHNKN